MDGQNTLDVSADLLELSKCPMMVVSAGVKAILDIGRTLEYLVSRTRAGLLANFFFKI